MEITLHLPEKIYRDIATAARQERRQVVDLIVDVVQEKYSAGRPLSGYSDEEVLALANLQMPKNQSARHSQLLYKNQAGTLKPAERKELDFFQQVYGAALLRKAEGVYEAVQRKLIQSPADLKNE